VTDAPGQVFLPAGAIASRVEEMGAAIARDHPGGPLTLVAILKGGVVLCADLARAIPVPHRIDHLQLAPYTAAGDRMRILMDLSRPVRGERVIVVEDLVDTGLTLRNVVGALSARGAASVEICTLLDRPHRRLADIDVRYVGFTAADRPLVGYGLGHRDRFRTLPDIRYLAA
jgi:hypoxanthine phosphoribosyltransferase